MSDFEPFGFATRKSELKFWEIVADAIYDGYPYYCLRPNPKICAVHWDVLVFGWWVEERILILKGERHV